MNALLSLLGLYNYDESILDGLSDNLPDGVDADTVKTSILAETAELEVIYPDPAVMKTMISVWGKSMKPVWAKMYATTTVEYNPIYNYDRTEEWTDTGTGKRTNETSGSGKVTDSGTRDVSTSVDETITDSGSRDASTSVNDTITDSGSRDATVKLDSDTTTSGTDTGKTTGSSSESSSNNHNVVGFNGTSATLDNSDVYSGSGSSETDTSATTSGTVAQDDTTTTKETSGNTRTDKGTTTATETNGNTRTDKGTTTATETNGNTRDLSNTETETENTENSATRQGRAYGNIGVTTTQTMLEQEREVVKFNFYEYLTDCFKQRFCLMVY